MGGGATMSIPINVKVENSDNDLTGPGKNGLCGSSTAVVVAVKAENEISDKFDIDELGHIPLHKRMKMMPSRRHSILSDSSDLKFSHKNISHKWQRCSAETCFMVDPLDPLEDAPVRDSASLAKSVDHGVGDENLPVVIALFAPKGSVDKVPEMNADEHFITPTANVPTKNIAGNSFTDIEWSEIRNCQNKVSCEKCDSQQPQENVSISSYHKLHQSFPGKKVENTKNDDGSCKIGLGCISCSNMPAVKVENTENDDDSHNFGLGGISCSNIPVVNVETKIRGDFDMDELDHMPFQERINVLQSHKFSDLGDSSNLKLSQQSGSSALTDDSFYSSKLKASGITLKRQRCSMESAVEKDAPGFLQEASVRDSDHGDRDENLPVVIALFAPKYYADGVAERKADEYFSTSTANVPTKNIAGNSCTITERSEIRNCKNKKRHQENVNINSYQKPCQSFPGKVKIDNTENDNGSGKIGLGGISCFNTPAVQVGDFDVDELDHMPLQTRIKMLLFHKFSDLGDSINLKCSQRSVPSTPRCDSSNSSNPKACGITLNSERCSMETTIEKDASGFLQDLSVEGPMYLLKHLNTSIGGLKDENHLQEESYTNRNPRIAENSAQTSAASLNMSTFPIKMKVENPENDQASSYEKVLKGFSSANVVTVGVKTELPEEFNVDGLDHIPLKQRINMLLAGKLAVSRSSNSLQGTGPCAQNCDSIDVLNLKASCITNKRKRKKTPTCSAETALEEDAPGLLQVLKEKGINVDEIRLYGEMEDVDPLVTTEGDSFVDLEAVISKLFSQRSMLLKLAPLQHSKDARATYCLACLVSLIDQTRQLKLHKWPVEWGWCRDLQSFIFIFERHNRIVLERPEYGYATYFFELVESLPIKWQIMRLVATMKLTNCSRIALIENKSLLVGEDLTEGEAQALEGYGWKRNTGLGAMLNYCDRVVHDRKKENRISDWRSKIGKLLMDGYDHGHIVLDQLPTKAIEYNEVRNHPPKMVIEYNEDLPKKVVESNEGLPKKFVYYSEDLLNKVADYNEDLPKKVVGYNEDLPKKVIEYNEDLPKKVQEYNEDLPKKMLEYSEDLPNKVVNYNEHLPKKLVEYHEDLPIKVMERNEDLPNKVVEYRDACDILPVIEYNEIRRIPQVKVEL